MPYEEHAKHVVDLSFVPIGAIVEAADGGNGCGLVGVGFDPDAGVVADGEHVVNDLEAGITGGIVDGGDVSDHGELGGGVIFEEVEGREDSCRRNVDRELVLPHTKSVVPVRRCWGDVCTGGRTAVCIWADMRAGIDRTDARTRLCGCICLRAVISGPFATLFFVHSTETIPAGLTMGT